MYLTFQCTYNTYVTRGTRSYVVRDLGSYVMVAGPSRRKENKKIRKPKRSILNSEDYPGIDHVCNNIHM